LVLRQWNTCSNVYSIRLLGGFPHPPKNYNSPQRLPNCRPKSFFHRDNELQIYHGKFLLMNNNQGKLFVIKQSKGCKFMSKMHQNTFGGWASPGPAGLTEIAGLGIDGRLRRGGRCRTGQWRTGHWRTDTSTIKSQIIKSMSPLHILNSTQNSTNCPKLVIIHITKRHSFIVLCSLHSLYPIKCLHLHEYAYHQAGPSTNGHTGHVPRVPGFFSFWGAPSGCGEIIFLN